MGRIRWSAPVQAVVAVGLGCAFSVQAAVPVLNHLFPAGAGPGSSNTIQLSGKFEPWPTEFWVEGKDVSFKASTEAGRVAVEVASDAIPGVRWVRAFNAEGASEPRLFVIGASTELVDAEPNDAFGSPQAVGSLPATINGRLDKRGDVDSFGLNLCAGEWLDARMEAYTLMSQVDGVLRLVTTNGQSLAWNHDSLALDPRLAWRSPVDQTVVVQAYGFKYPADSSIQLTGGEGAVYRLHLRKGFDAPDGPLPIPATNTVAEPPALLRGVLATDDVENFHGFRAVKDRLHTLRLAAQSLGAPWDAQIRILDGDGKELAGNDDLDGTSDPGLDWRAPADGVYRVGVRSRTRRGDADCRYELAIAAASPAFRATVASTSWTVTCGATQDVKVAVTRMNGFTNELRISFEQLPEGLASEPATCPSGSGEAALRLVAAPQAPVISTP
ncbi:MAG: hypothetical protein AB7O66_25370, partial [Limisphaerales bacterium]